MGFDSRIADAMLSLGYRIFPFEAFDQTGNLLVPDSVDFPADVDAGLGRIVANPAWKDLYRVMSPLQRQRRVFMAGIGFMNDRVQVALFKSTTTVGNANEALSWADGYYGTTEASMHAYAGESYLLDPQFRMIIDKARGMLPAAQQDVDADVASATIQTDSEDAPPTEEPANSQALAPWLKFGLDLLADVVTKATVRTKVLTTVAWYASQVADQTFAANWKPIHANLQTGWLSGHRSAHLIWNPVGAPVTWFGSGVAWKGPGLDMPHTPVQWCQALRPLADCIGHPLAEPEDVVAAAEA